MESSQPSDATAGWDALVIHPNDDVAVALRDIGAGETVDVRRGGMIHRMLVREAISLGHKFALTDLARGAAIRKYGECIGVVTADIAAGSHVHVHNMASGRARPKVPP